MSAPIGADHAVEAVAPPQETGDHVAVVAEADFFVRCSDRAPVVRHDLRRPGLERRFEDAQVVLEPVAGIDLILAVGEMRILPVALRPAAGEVLGHARDGFGPELVALETADVRGQEASGELRVLAEGVHAPRPPRLGGQIGHRVQRDVDADSPVLAPRYVAELAHGRLVPQGTEADWLGPVREAARRPACADALGEAVPRIRCDRHRDAEPGRFGEPLHPVLPLGLQARLRREVDVEVVEPATDHELLRVPADKLVATIEQRPIRVHENRRVEHQSRLLLEGHLRQKIGNADLQRLSRILVRVEPPVPVQIPVTGQVSGRRGHRSAPL